MISLDTTMQYIVKVSEDACAFNEEIEKKREYLEKVSEVACALNKVFEQTVTDPHNVFRHIPVSERGNIIKAIDAVGQAAIEIAPAMSLQDLEKATNLITKAADKAKQGKPSVIKRIINDLKIRFGSFPSHHASALHEQARSLIENRVPQQIERKRQDLLAAQTSIAAEAQSQQSEATMALLAAILVQHSLLQMR